MIGKKFKSLLALAVVCLLSAGCTGTSINVNPDPEALKPFLAKKCGAVGVKETPAEHVYPPAGNLVAGFAASLEKSGLAENVYYPTRPDDKVDLILDAKFDIVFDPNMGGNLTKSFFTGLTLFILEPAFWYNYNYALSGKVDLLEGKKVVKTILANSEAEMSMKFLSLAETQKLEGETLIKAKESLYRQLFAQISSYCNK